MDSNLLIAGATFVVLILMTLLFYLYFRSLSGSRKLMKRIMHEGHEERESADTHHTISRRPDHLKQFFTKFASVFGNLAKPKSEEDLSRLQKSLLNMGYRGKNSAMIYLGIKVICALSLPAILFLSHLFVPFHVNPLHSIILYILLAMAGFYLPTIWLRLKIASRKAKLLDGFPDALDMLVVCVEAGMGMDAAIERVGDEIEMENDVLSEELKLYNKEMRIGKTRRRALKDLALRTGLEDVSTLTTLLIQTDKFGTSLAQALKAHSDFMRIQRYQRAEEKAAKLTVKLVIPLVFCIFPALFIVMLGPAIIQAFRLNS